MLRVVIDTNVVVSALMSPNGKPANILNLVTDLTLQVCYSQKILAEYTEVLNRPRFKFSYKDRNNFIQGTQQSGLLVNPPVSNILLPDEDDRCFYDVANFSDAILITGNIKHYPSAHFIVTPSEFLTLLGM